MNTLTLVIAILNPRSRNSDKKKTLQESMVQSQNVVSTYY